MQTLALALSRRGSSGMPLPDAFPSLATRGITVRRGEVCILLGPPSGGKSLFGFNLLSRLNMPSLAFLLDTTPLQGVTKFGCLMTGEEYRAIKDKIMAGDESYQEGLAEKMPDVHTVWYAPGVDDVYRQVDAFTQRYGLPPEIVFIDNLGNQTSGLDNEWAWLKALTLELDQMAKTEQTAVVATHHTSDVTSMEPQARDKMLGKISQYPGLILSINYNPDTLEYKVAAVKDREGVSDLRAQNPIVMYADPSRMAITDSAQLAQSWREARQGGWR